MGTTLVAWKHSLSERVACLALLRPSETPITSLRVCREHMKLACANHMLLVLLVIIAMIN